VNAALLFTFPIDRSFLHFRFERARSGRIKPHITGTEQTARRTTLRALHEAA
jgi:hypothetical protein